MPDSDTERTSDSKIEKNSGFITRLRRMPNDSVMKTLLVATLLCLVCSIIVSTAAIGLKPRQELNKALDRKQNILAVAGITGEGKSVDELFEQIQTRVVDLDTGEYSDAVDALTFDQRAAASNPLFAVDVPSAVDIAGLGRHSRYATVYLVVDAGSLERVILPISGYGLWSTLYGFVCIEGDGNTVCGISFYEHAETPGLGGEVDNPRWQALWPGRELTDTNGETRIEVVKGRVDPTSSGAIHKVDGLAGATLTSRGVSNLVRYWVGENGFGPFLQGLREGA